MSKQPTMSQAWEMVEAVQRKHPGWRFSLLGGDASMGYKNNDVFKGVDENTRRFFGWHAEFFGHEDPRLCTGQRHASVYADSPQEAIRQACEVVL